MKDSIQHIGRNCFQFFLCSVMLLWMAGCGNSGQDEQRGVVESEEGTLCSFDISLKEKSVFPGRSIRLDNANLSQVLGVYSEVSRRLIIPARNLPEVKVSFSNAKEISAVELLQTLDTILAAQEITMVVFGDRYMKAVTSAEAYKETPPVLELAPEDLPDSDSYLTYIVRVKDIPNTRITSVLAPFARLQNSIMAIGPEKGKASGLSSSIREYTKGILPTGDESIVILRDYSSNVKRMMQVLEELKKSG